MDIKALFFDIDGTLVSFKTHRIPESTVLALREAKARGIRVYISTGRPMAIITNLGQIAPLIDGYITTNGACCMVGGHVICCNGMDRHDIDTLIADADAHDYPVIVVGERRFVVHNAKPIVQRIFVDGLGVTNIDFGETLADLGEERVLQMTPFITVEQQEALAPRMAHSTFGRWHPEFVDITRAGTDKASGLEAMMRHEQLEAGETMAFGDGGNDIPILCRAGTGVAMGNATDDVKAAADYVTRDIDDDGVYHALRHFDVI